MGPGMGLCFSNSHLASHKNLPSNLWRVLPGRGSRLSDKAHDTFDNELRQLWLSRLLGLVRCSENVNEDA